MVVAVLLPLGLSETETLLQFRIIKYVQCKNKLDFFRSRAQLVDIAFFSDKLDDFIEI